MWTWGSLRLAPITRRSDFDCEILLIANCEFFHNSQSKESQVKEYAMNNITRDHAPSAQARAQMRSRSRSLTFPAYTGSLDVEIEMNLRQYFESTVNLPCTNTQPSKAVANTLEHKGPCGDTLTISMLERSD